MLHAAEQAGRTLGDLELLGRVVVALAAGPDAPAQGSLTIAAAGVVLATVPLEVHAREAAAAAPARGATIELGLAAGWLRFAGPPALGEPTTEDYRLDGGPLVEARLTYLGGAHAGAELDVGLMRTGLAGVDGGLAVPIVRAHLVYAHARGPWGVRGLVGGGLAGLPATTYRTRPDVDGFMSLGLSLSRRLTARWSLRLDGRDAIGNGPTTLAHGVEVSLGLSTPLE
jgi:hypothetical protein